ncbi:MAG: MaoC family dehydratase N-terminal domain-containing protein [Candidatus Binataceae bacterium]|jgi:acyl dehydratase
MATNQLIDFETLKVGDTLGPEHLFVGKQHTRLFVRAAHMDSPRFTDDDWARSQGLPGAILPGNMSLSLLTKLLTDWIGNANARLVRLGTTYRSPVVTEHTVTMQGFVTHTNPAERTADIDLWMENEDADRLVIGTATVHFPAKN